MMYADCRRKRVPAPGARIPSEGSGGYTLETMTTLELIDRIRAGDDVQGSLEELYRRVREALLERIRGKISGRVQKRLDAEDVLHGAFLRAVGALDGFQATDDRSFFAWVYRISKNLILDTAKRRSLEALPMAHDVGDAGPRASGIAARQRGVSTEYSQREEAQALLGGLNEEDAEVIRLRIFQGLSFEAIAERWKKKPGTVRRFFSRALERLRRNVGPGDGED